jgi:hypothetical protein
MNSDSNIPRNFVTLQEAGLWRIYKSSDAYELAYVHDCEWFATHHRPKRHLSVRGRVVREFDLLSTSASASAFPPPSLWICVVEISPGLHVAFPVWRGDAFFRTYSFKHAAVADVSGDHEIAVLLDEYSRRGGFDDGTTRQLWRRD